MPAFAADSITLILKNGDRISGVILTENANRVVLQRIADSGQIFFARSDEPWVLSGASVHISFIGQCSSSESDIELNGRAVDAIHPDLTTGLDLIVDESLEPGQDIAHARSLAPRTDRLRPHIAQSR